MQSQQTNCTSDLYEQDKSMLPPSTAAKVIGNTTNSVFRSHDTFPHSNKVIVRSVDMFNNILKDIKKDNNPINRCKSTISIQNKEVTPQSKA